MAYGRPATVRSHRRGGPRRRLNIAPWIVISMVVALVAGGLTGGYLWLIKQSCSGQTRATIIASPATAPILEGLSRQWATREPSVDGKCASVVIETKDSAEVAVALQNPWDAKVSGPAPDAWVPQSTAWVRKAASDADAERMIPDLQPSIARSPTVIAMPKPMAEKLGWPQKALNWQDIINAATGRSGWAAYGQPDWGPFRLGMTNPAVSTAGLLALTAILDADDDEEISAEEQESLYRLKQVMAVYAERTEDILTQFVRESAQGTEAGLKYISAFPALEQDVLNHNLRNPKAPLVAIYPNNGSIEADHPFLVLNAEWSRTEAQKVATEFMIFVRGEVGEKQLLDAGFRDSNRVPGKDLTLQNGLAPQITALPRAVLLPDSVARTVTTWTAATRSTNVLIVLDISGSMDEVVPGFAKTRLVMAKKAATDAVTLFGDDARVGLWVFSSALSGTRDYNVLVPLDKLSNVVNGRTRRAQMLSSIAGLVARNDTGLYDTVAAAQKALLDGYQPGSFNLVVVMTDGRNDDPTGGLNLDQLKTQLTNNATSSGHQVPIATVAYGEKADYEALKQISTLTGGIAFESRESFDINRVLQSAIFSDQQ